MPFPNEHSARVRQPGDFTPGSFRRKQVSPGVSIVMGRLKGETTMTAQAYRFAKTKFTADQARAWLKEHKIKFIRFEPAGEANKPFHAVCKDCGKPATVNHGDVSENECGDCGGALMSATVKHVNLEPMHVFSAGKWKGKNYTEAHLDQMVANYKAGILRPYLKITRDGEHGEIGDAPLLESLAFGWVSKLFRQGKKLFAAFKQVPEEIAKLITGGALKQKSAEIWHDFQTTDGKRHGMALECILMFGTGIPGVHNLDDAAAYYTYPDTEDISAIIDFLGVTEAGAAASDDTSNNPPPDGGNGPAEADPDETTEKETDDVDLKPEEYKGLVAAKERLNVVEQEMTRFKKETETTAAKLKDVEAKAAKLTAERDAALKQIADAKRTDVEAFVGKLVDDMQLEPARKEAVVEEILARSDEDAKAYKDRLSALPALPTKEQVDAAEREKSDTKVQGVDTEARHKKIRALMKVNPKLSYTEAEEQLFGGDGGEDD